MPLIDSFLHPATGFFILGLLLPLFRGRSWRWVLFLPPSLAIFLVLRMHLGSFWAISYVGQELVLGRVDTLSYLFPGSFCHPFLHLYDLCLSCAYQGPSCGLPLFHGGRFRVPAGRRLLDPLYLLAVHDRFLGLPDLVERKAAFGGSRVSLYAASPLKQRAPPGRDSFEAEGYRNVRFRAGGFRYDVSLRLAHSDGFLHQCRRCSAACLVDRCLSGVYHSRRRFPFGIYRQDGGVRHDPVFRGIGFPVFYRGGHGPLWCIFRP